MRKAVQIFSDKPQLCCCYCGKNLLDEDRSGNFIVFKEQDTNKLSCIKYACKEHDELVTNTTRKEGLKDAGWDDIDDLLIPTIWVRKFIAFVNDMFESRENISPEYFNDVKLMFLNTFPYIAREMNGNEIERIGKLLQLEF